MNKENQIFGGFSFLDTPQKSVILINSIFDVIYVIAMYNCFGIDNRYYNYLIILIVRHVLVYYSHLALNKSNRFNLKKKLADVSHTDRQRDSIPYRLKETEMHMVSVIQL